MYYRNTYQFLVHIIIIFCKLFLNFFIFSRFAVFFVWPLYCFCVFLLIFYMFLVCFLLILTVIIYHQVLLIVVFILILTKMLTAFKIIITTLWMISNYFLPPCFFFLKVWLNNKSNIKKLRFLVILIVSVLLFLQKHIKTQDNHEAIRGCSKH